MGLRVGQLARRLPVRLRDGRDCAAGSGLAVSETHPWGRVKNIAHEIDRHRDGLTRRGTDPSPRVLSGARSEDLRGGVFVHCETRARSGRDLRFPVNSKPGRVWTGGRLFYVAPERLVVAVTPRGNAQRVERRAHGTLRGAASGQCSGSSPHAVACRQCIRSDSA